MGKNLYTERFYDYQRSTSALSAQKIFPLIKEYLDVNSIISDFSRVNIVKSVRGFK